MDCLEKGLLTELSDSIERATAGPSGALVDGENISFTKARILAGQADLAIAQDKNIEDFKWMSKDEVDKLVAPEYWLRVKNML